MGNRLRTGLVLTVTLVWAANAVAPIFVKGYEPPAELNVAFMAVLGILTGASGRPPSDKNDNNGRSGAV